MSLFGKIAVIGAVLFVTMSLSFLVPLPQRVVDLPGLAPFVLDGALFLGLALACLVAVASDSIVRGHPASRNANLAYAVAFWPLPCLLTAWAVVMLHQFDVLLYQQAGGLMLVGLVSAVLAAQYHGISASSVSEQGPSSGWFLTMISAALSALLLWASYISAVPPWQQAVGVGVVSAALALEWLRDRARIGQSWLASLLVGLCMAEIGWLFMTGSMEPLYAVLCSFAILYYVASLLQQAMAKPVTKTLMAEYALLGAVGMGLFWYYVP